MTTDAPERTAPVNGVPYRPADTAAAVTPTEVTGQQPSSDRSPTAAPAAATDIYPGTMTGHPMTPPHADDRSSSLTAVTAPAAVTQPVTGRDDRTPPEGRRSSVNAADRANAAKAPGVIRRTTDWYIDATSDPLRPLWAKLFLFVALMMVTGIVTWFAMDGQVEGAKVYGIAEDKAFAVPFLLEFAVLVLLLVGYLQALELNPYLPYWIGAAVLTGMAAGLNFAHVSGIAGLIYGVSTLVTIGLWFVKLYTALKKRLRKADKLPTKPPKFSRRLRKDYPTLVQRAEMICRRLSIETAQQALLLAEVWLRVYEGCIHDMGDTDKKLAERLAQNTADDAVFRAAGHPVADIPTTIVVSRVNIDNTAADEQPTGTATDANNALPGTEKVAERPAPRPRAASAKGAAVKGAGRGKAAPAERFDPLEMRRFAEFYHADVALVAQKIPNYLDAGQQTSKRVIEEITGKSSGTAFKIAKYIRFLQQQHQEAKA